MFDFWHFGEKTNFIVRFLRIHPVQSVINNPTQLSGRRFPRIFHMKLFLSQLYIFGYFKMEAGPCNLKIWKCEFWNFEFWIRQYWRHWASVSPFLAPNPEKNKTSGTKSDRSAGVRCISSSMEVMELEAHLTSPTDRRATPRMIQHGQRCP